MRLIKPLEKNINHPIPKSIYGSNTETRKLYINLCIKIQKNPHGNKNPENQLMVMKQVQRWCIHISLYTNYLLYLQNQQLKDHNFFLFLFFGRENRVLWPWKVKQSSYMSQPSRKNDWNCSKTSKSTMKAATPHGELPSDGRLWVLRRRSQGDMEKSQSGSIDESHLTMSSRTIGVTKRTQLNCDSASSTADS